MLMGTNSLDITKIYFQRNTKAASLAVFRFLFGFIMMASIVRFWYNGWIEKLYTLPQFHFHYTGFSWISIPDNLLYILFFCCGLAAFSISIGYKYKIAIISFFLSFTFIELIDKTTYLNHYYFVSVMSFILIWLPAHCSYSVDSYIRPQLRSEYVKTWNVDVIKLMLAIVYIYAGAAKLNNDWMLQAMPLSIWLPTKMDIPLLGSLMQERWMHYLFSWGGAVYDLFIVFFLMWRRTRLLAFMAVIVFHILTRILFPIGMFPYIMICCTMIFFSAAFHTKLISSIVKFVGIDPTLFQNNRVYNSGVMESISLGVLSCFMLFQLLFPLRHFLYDGNVFWTERGYRYAWRVMLMEKTGYANYKIVDGKTGRRFYIQNDDFLTAQQQKEMSTQPDFILEYGQYLGNHFSSQGHENVEVYVESYAALNGRRSQKYIDHKVDLMSVDYAELCRSHITPMHD